MKKTDQGNTLIVVIAIIATMVAIVGSSLEYTQGIARRAQRERTNVSAQAIGDGCFELMFSAWRQICRRGTQVMPAEPYSFGTYATPYSYSCLRWGPPPTTAFANIQLPTAAMFPNVPGFTVTRGANDPGLSYTVSNYTIQAIDSTFATTTADPPLSSIPTTQQPPGAYFGGFYYRSNGSWYYLASADVTLPTPAGKVTTKMRRIFEKKMTKPPADYLMFFNDDLELNASSTSPTTFNGQIHTNGTLYTGTSDLTFNATIPKLIGGDNSGGSGYFGMIPNNSAVAVGPAKTRGVSYGDDWVIGFKPGDIFHAGTPAAPVLAASTPVQRGPKFVPFDWDANGWTSADANLNNDDPHELIEKPSIPLSTHPDPLSAYVGDRTNSTYGAAAAGGIKSASMYFATQRLFTRCGTRIDISATNVITVTNAVNASNPTVDPHYGTGETLTSTSIGPENTTVNTTTEYYVYRWTHDMWKTALGVAPSALNAGQVLPYRRVTNGVTTSASKTVTSATMAFVATDVGRLVKGTLSNGNPAIPDGAFIKTVTNGTTIQLSHNALASGTGVTLEMEGATSASGAAPLVAHIQDNREASAVELITLDLDVFKAWDGGVPGPPSTYFHGAPNWTYSTGGSAPDGDLRRQQTSYAATGPNVSNIFISVAPVAGRKRAIRIKNGGRVDRQNPDPGSPATTITSYVPFGFMLVMDCPLYIQGDFGTGRTNANKATQPKSNNNSLTTNTVDRTSAFEDPKTDGLNEGGPGVLLAADAITVLSNAWNDANSSLALNPNRVASNTTINARIMAGDVPTASPNYSGGGENFLRLLEDWGGKYLTFTGTLTQLYHSKIATGYWGRPNVYSEPSRVAGVGGRYFYQQTVYQWGCQDEVKAFSYLKHKWSPTP